MKNTKLKEVNGCEFSLNKNEFGMNDTALLYYSCSNKNVQNYRIQLEVINWKNDTVILFEDVMIPNFEREYKLNCVNRFRFCICFQK